MDPRGTPELTSSPADVFPLRTFLSNRLSDMSLYIQLLVLVFVCKNFDFDKIGRWEDFPVQILAQSVMKFHYISCIHQVQVLGI